MRSALVLPAVDSFPPVRPSISTSYLCPSFGINRQRRGHLRRLSSTSDLMEKGREFLGDLRDGVSESSLKIDVSELSKELSDTDDFGKRGELFVVGQVALGLLVVAPIVDLEPLARILGFGAMNLALAIIWAGVGSLGESLTPLPQPRKKAELTTDGMFK